MNSPIVSMLTGLLLYSVMLQPVRGNAADPAPAYSIEGQVVFDGQGEIYLDLVQADGFFDQKPRKPWLLVLKPGREQMESKSIPFRLSKVPAGTYAIRVFQDENRNGILDTALLGPPKEPWAMHRPVSGMMRRPRFEDCAFEVSRSLSGIRIVLKK